MSFGPAAVLAQNWRNQSLPIIRFVITTARHSGGKRLLDKGWKRQLSVSVVWSGSDELKPIFSELERLHVLTQHARKFPSL